MEPIIFEKKGPIGWLILNRPEQKNALSVELINKMQKYLNFIAKEKDIRVVVIKGNDSDFLCWS
ncbi:MAG: enoyl-CoA hydratase/isomerase family protein [Thermoplasmatota archaeon]|jgi:enoyl-CoA hydratase